ncbi:coiled-coil domain-containing protein 141-like [Etheostoma cragini]|uniref:coiled-coil domain-containing protein 141-like n=1 Tax=Etheostoma cragini TaxID=417921 RepID=UPI00155F24BB|nr:coiled-coil domain-containing protein 141-like [Etheostoma cragini]
MRFQPCREDNIHRLLYTPGKLDAEVESLRRIRNSLGVLDWLEEEGSAETRWDLSELLNLQEEEGPAETEGDLSELLDLQQRVKTKISQSETILDLSRSFHLTASQLEALLQSEAAGSRDQQQIQNMLQTASTLKTEIVTISGGTCFSVEQLEVRLLSLDSRCVSRRDAAQRHKEKLRLTRLLSDDITQLRDSFKELKKRFNNLRFNFLKRNDRRGNTKAIRNHLQQVELNEEKLQALRKRVQGVAARLGSEVRDGGVAREAEDAVNQLQRQMGEFERSVGEHQKTLEMTCRLQLAMEEYQWWCEDASATIARVGRFSSECRSTDAVSVLQRQFETFVWPTVPQQEERIGQIRELATRLHGAEEGRRYVEKTVSKHSAMVASIRELSNDLMELQAKLKRSAKSDTNVFAIL